MKIIVDQDSCIGCGMCINICPEVFKYNSEDKSETLQENIADDFKEKVIEAKDVCPVDAIRVD